MVTDCTIAFDRDVCSAAVDPPGRSDPDCASPELGVDDICPELTYAEVY